MIQFLVNGIIASCQYVLIGFAFALIYRTDRFIDCTLGIAYVSAAYIAFTMEALSGLTPIWGYFCAILGVSLFGFLSSQLIFKPLRRSGSSETICFLASLGVYIVLQNIVSLIWGDATRTFHFGQMSSGYSLFGARITSYQINAIFMTVCIIALMAYIISCTKIGLYLRSIGQDSELAAIYGIQRNIYWNYIHVGAAVLAGLAGISGAYAGDLRPTMGFSPILMGIILCLIGGRKSILGVVRGAVLLAFCVILSEIVFGTKWKECAAFSLLLIYIILEMSRKTTKTGLEKT